MRGISKFVHRSTLKVMGLALAGSMITAPPLFASDSDHSSHSAPSALVLKVRQATAKFIDVNNAGPDYGPAFGCVSGPDHGAMGIHYVNGTLLMDDQVVAEQPEALIYEPVGNARRLVGVEYIVDAGKWKAANGGAPPALDGQVFNFIDAPNRFGLDPFFELHVWAWRDNPQGAFVDWNNNVSCEHQ